MAELTRVQLTPDGIQQPDTSPAATLSDAEVLQRMQGPAGGVTSIQFDSDGNTVAASNTGSLQQVNTGGGAPSNIYQNQINDLQRQMDRLIDEWRSLDPADPRRKKIIAESQKLEKQAIELKRMENQAIAHGAAERVRERDATLSRLRADKAIVDADLKQLAINQGNQRKILPKRR